jgi:uncharacterized membrane protein YdbT with pleckstrin-like domain
MKFLSIFTESPNSFQGQNTNEKVLIFLRRHPFVIIIRIIGLAIAYALPILISLVFTDFVLLNNLIGLYLFTVSIWSLFFWLAIFYSFTMYTLDVWIITDSRIIDSTQHGFFNRTTSELHLTRIQDISVNVNGPVESILNFGELNIQTAGTEGRFKLQQIPNPAYVKDALMKMAFK